MRRAFLLWCCLAAPGIATAQGWSWVSPKPQGVAIHALASVAGSVPQLWLVGAGGTIQTTTDFAQTFSPQSSGVSADLYGVFFLDALNGWAVGDAGTIVHTSDGGAHWRAQPSQSSRRLRGVYFTDAQHGFVVGDYRTLLQTSDGGATWTGRGSTALSLDAITFTDALHGYIAGDSGTLLVTSDGGATFTSVQTPSSAHLLALAFGDAAHGFAVGQGGSIVTTNDGGKSFTAQVVGNDDLVGVTALSATTAYALGASGKLYGTVDGATWALLETLSGGVTLFTGLCRDAQGALNAVNASGLWLRAAGAQRPPVFVDVNDLLPRSAKVTGVAFGSVDAGVFVVDGYLYETGDRGQHLAKVVPDAGANAAWTAVSAPGGADVFAVGIHGLAAVSHDDGRSWLLLSTPTNEDLSAVQFLDAQHGIAAGVSGTLLSTANGGTTWTVITPAVADNFSALAFLDPTHGVVVGQFGEAVDTVDGQLFSASSGSLHQSFLAAAYPAPGVVIVGGDQGALFHSLDQGETFYALASPAAATPVSALAFADHANGWLANGSPGGGVAGGGSIWVTRDGAQTFAVQFSGAPSIAGFSFPDRIHGYAVGGGGTVLTTASGGGAVCQADADCAGDGGGSQCLAGACQPCTQDSRCGSSCGACSAPTPYCYGGYCGACLSDLECGDAGAYCVLGLCQVAAVSDGGLADAGPTPIPDAGTPRGRTDAGATTTGGSCANGTCNSGCGCASRPGGAQGGTWPWMVGLFLLLFLPRRRARG